MHTVLPTRFVARASLVALALLGTSCAGMRIADEQKAYYLKEAGSFRYEKGCLDVWPDVLKLLGSKGYPLVGRDRQYAGEGKRGSFSALVEQGDETQAVEGGGLVVKTGWQPDGTGSSRYRVTGSPGTPSGCVVTFTYIWTGTVDPSDARQEVDWKIQLELLRKLEPAAAARLEAGAPTK
jgi:hypothetical protein